MADLDLNASHLQMTTSNWMGYVSKRHICLPNRGEINIQQGYVSRRWEHETRTCLSGYSPENREAGMIFIHGWNSWTFWHHWVSKQKEVRRKCKISWIYFKWYNWMKTEIGKLDLSSWESQYPQYCLWVSLLPKLNNFQKVNLAP